MNRYYKALGISESGDLSVFGSTLYFSEELVLRDEVVFLCMQTHIRILRKSFLGCSLGRPENLQPRMRQYEACLRILFIRKETDSRRRFIIAIIHELRCHSPEIISCPSMIFRPGLVLFWSIVFLDGVGSLA